MSSTLKSKFRYAFEVAIAFAPWVLSMYVLYWLEYGGIWTTDTAHRGKTAFAILAVGMSLSFLIQSSIAKRRKK